MVDWRYGVDTRIPGTRWTQWVFLELYNRGLAYRKKAAVTGARSTRPCGERAVINGECERCGSKVEHASSSSGSFDLEIRPRLLANLDRLDCRRPRRPRKRKLDRQVRGSGDPLRGGGGVTGDGVTGADHERRSPCSPRGRITIFRCDLSGAGSGAPLAGPLTTADQRARPRA